MDNVVVFPKRASGLKLASEREVNSPSRSETMIRTLDAILDNMVRARGFAWTEAIINSALARQAEQVLEG